VFSNNFERGICVTNSYIKARNALVSAWMVLVVGPLIGFAIPFSWWLIARGPLISLYPQMLRNSLMLACCCVMASRVGILFFAFRRSIGIAPMVGHGLISLLVSVVIGAAILIIAWDKNWQHQFPHLLIMLAVWLMLTIVEPIISLVRMGKLTEWYKKSLCQ